MRLTILLLALMMTAAATLAQSTPPEESQAPISELCRYVAEVTLPEPYERETYRMSFSGRPDPTRPPSVITEREVVLPPVALTAVLTNDRDPSRSVAILRLEDDPGKQHRVRAGDRIGEIEVLAIRPSEVDIRVHHFGQARTETLRLTR